MSSWDANRGVGWALVSIEELTTVLIETLTGTGVPPGPSAPIPGLPPPEGQVRNTPETGLFLGFKDVPPPLADAPLGLGPEGRPAQPPSGEHLRRHQERAGVARQPPLRHRGPVSQPVLRLGPLLAAASVGGYLGCHAGGPRAWSGLPRSASTGAGVDPRPRRRPRRRGHRGRASGASKPVGVAAAATEAWPEVPRSSRCGPNAWIGCQFPGAGRRRRQPPVADGPWCIPGTTAVRCGARRCGPHAATGRREARRSLPDPPWAGGSGRRGVGPPLLRDGQGPPAPRGAAGALATIRPFGPSEGSRTLVRPALPCPRARPYPRPQPRPLCPGRHGSPPPSRDRAKGCAA